MEEKRTRMRLLRDIVRDHNVQRWARSFMQAAAGVKDEPKVKNGSGGSAILKERATETPGVALVAASYSGGSLASRPLDRRGL